ncbi:uncharacterized protein VTP21DRAFT_9456 [Calcarisporiella thermophila]|uniref:uncharacterized protein n=1 Tax=Calcarisporiella thermophila TaxID=911321 RepID=UPI0037420AA3
MKFIGIVFLAALVTTCRAAPPPSRREINIQGLMLPDLNGLIQIKNPKETPAPSNAVPVPTATSVPQPDNPVKHKKHHSHHRKHKHKQAHKKGKKAASKASDFSKDMS